MDNLKHCITKKTMHMSNLIILFSCFLFSISCNSSQDKNNSKAEVVKNNPKSSPTEFAFIKSIPLPEGYKRIENGDDSFAAWLQNVALKKDNTVYKFDGTPKYNQEAQFAVLDISVGKKDLQQCADAVMRLRAEYLFSQKRFNEIIFTDNEHIQYKFAAPFDRENFTKYLDRVFGMCGSASLAKQLKTVNEIKNIKSGDVIIRGGFPGHAVTVMDVAENSEGKKIYLLSQSYMPAQDIHVLKNPMNETLSPWYEANEESIIQTPEYKFFKTELKTW